MKKAYRNMALAAAVVLSASSLLGCNSIVQIPDALKVQQGNANYDQYPYNDGEVLDYVGKSLDNIQTNAGKIIFNEIKRAHSAYKLNNGIIKIYHIGRNKKRIFDANVYFWNGIIWENIKIHTDFKKSKNLFSDGSGKKEYDENFLRFKNRKHK